MIVVSVEVDEEAVDVSATIDVQANLTILVGEAEVARRSKHELTAAHVVVHAVLQRRHQSVSIQSIEVNEPVRRDLQPDVLLGRRIEEETL